MNPSPFILIVDDQRALTRLWVDVLAAHGYRAKAVRRSEEALAMVRYECPALILLDLRLGLEDGAELGRRLRVDVDLANVPIVLISGMAHEDGRGLRDELQATDFLVKPFSLKELVDSVGRWTGREGEDLHPRLAPVG